MQFLECNTRPMRSAVFVDFDNIFIRLSELDVNIARTFATRPLDWIAWLENSLPPYAGIDAGAKRNILVRRCYLNPKSFGNFRPYFIRGAFETVDCPSLTTQGKTSADVHMVVDLLDLLDHKVNYDEFIIMSADADFTPVLLKLRKWDRRTAVLAVGSTSPAYRAASDLVIDQDVFIEEALGGGSMAFSEPARIIRRAEGPASTAPVLSTEAVTVINGGATVLQESAAVRPVFSSFSPGGVRDTEKQRDQCSRLVQTFVRASPEAVTMAQLAYRIRQAFPDVGMDWQGKGSFKLFLSELDLGSLATSPVIPGYVYDPLRHAVPSGETGIRDEAFEAAEPELAALARKVHDLTDTPYLSPAHYGVLFASIAQEINHSGYNMTTVSKAVRDRCKEKEVPVARQHVNFVLRGIAFTGHRFGEGKETAQVLAERLLANTLNLCENAQLSLSEGEVTSLRRWFYAGLIP
ncbi:NYN domain-containing protein [Desulfobotulus sp. H1]|uniref:NYN domain-containing protein n=1 Tax=Desulfobotulus pelophilus TaxID=2823377 RepID=A0ABT3N505_9BACT|nr:NYN domain-containing protein [Desulfobotulus pelophilus]MCW7752546.1 NYN domain-containing protein [Desulfobotulus pelophilus]